MELFDREQIKRAVRYFPSETLESQISPLKRRYTDHIDHIYHTLVLFSPAGVPMKSSADRFRGSGHSLADKKKRKNVAPEKLTAVCSIIGLLYTTKYWSSNEIVVISMV